MLRMTAARTRAITSTRKPVRETCALTCMLIYLQLAGGVTADHVLHGSADPIGGQCQLIKLRWGAGPEEMKFEGAIPTIKFALGENVKQSNWGDQFVTRYPQTRMGVEGIAFCIARTLIERDPSLKAPMRANLRKMWELLEEREDHGAADMVDTMIKALNDPAFFKP